MQIEHDLVKLRPFVEASLQSREKAKTLGISSVDVYKKRPKTSMVAANRMLNRALGIRDGRDKQIDFSYKSGNNSSERDGAISRTAKNAISRHKWHVSAQRISDPIVTKSMANKSPGINSDNPKIPSSPNLESQGNNDSDIHKDKVSNDGSNKQTARLKNRNNYDPHLAANRMFKRALGSTISKSTTAGNNR